MSAVISTIVAIANNNVIGKDGALPWYLPAELAHFKEITLGHPIIMGRKTHESIGRALPGRTNIVISRNPRYKAAAGTVMVNSLEKALQLGRSKDKNEVFVIGGEAIYQEALPKVKRIYLTKVDADVDGDRFFRYNPKQWQTTSSEKHRADGKNPYDYEFLVLERVK